MSEEDKDFICPKCNNTGEYITGENMTRKSDGNTYYQQYYKQCACKYGKIKKGK